MLYAILNCCCYVFDLGLDNLSPIILAFWFVHHNTIRTYLWVSFTFSLSLFFFLVTESYIILLANLFSFWKPNSLIHCFSNRYGSFFCLISFPAYWVCLFFGKVLIFDFFFGVNLCGYGLSGSLICCLGTVFE